MGPSWLGRQEVKVKNAEVVILERRGADFVEYGNVWLGWSAERSVEAWLLAQVFYVYTKVT